MLNPYSEQAIQNQQDQERRVQQESVLPTVDSRQNYALPPGYTVDSRGPGYNSETFIQSAQPVFEGLKAKEEKAALQAKIENSVFFSNYLQISPDKAYAMHDQLMKSVYPQEQLSSETFAGRMKMVYDQKKMEQEIAMLRFNQMNGDSSEGTNNRILELKASQPMSSEIDRVMENLSSDWMDLPKKIVEAMRGTPYMMASQVPMWISQARHGIASAGAGAVAGAALGAAGAPVTAVSGGILGFLGGGARYEYMMEAGLAYDQMLSDAHDAGVKIDPKIARQAAKVSAALITAVDQVSLIAGGVAVFSGATKAVGAGIKELSKQSTKQILTAMMKDIGTATAEEAIGEATQEAIGGIASNLAYSLNEEIGNGHIDKQSAEEIFKNAMVAATMASTTAFIASGAGASLTATRNINTKMKAEENVRKVQRVQELASKSVEEINEVAGTDFTENTSQEEIRKTLLRNEGIKNQRVWTHRGLMKLDEEEFWNKTVEAFNLKRPEGVSIVKETEHEVVNRAQGIGSEVGKFTAKKKGDDMVMTGEIVDPKNFGTLSEVDFYEDQGTSGQLTIGEKLDVAGNPNVKLEGKVVQGDDGLHLEFEHDYPPGSTQHFLQQEMRNRMGDMFQEGPSIDINNLNLSENAKNMLNEYQDWVDLLGSVTMKELRDTGIKEMLVEIVQEQRRHKPGTAEHTALARILWDYSKLRNKFQSEAKGLGLTRDRLLSMQRDKTLFNKRRKEMVRLAEEEFGVAVLSDEELKQVDEAVDRKKSGMPARRIDEDLLRKAELLTLEQLTHDQLRELVRRTESEAIFGEGETSVNYHGLALPLRKVLALANDEVLTELKGAKEKNIQPADSVKRNVAKSIGEWAWKMLTINQTQYHFAVQHIAGENSVINEVLYRDMKASYNNWVNLKHQVSSSFNKDLIDAGVNFKELWKWGNETVDVGSWQFTKAQLASILMHSRNAYNWKHIQNKGMSFQKKGGGKVDIPSDVVTSALQVAKQDQMALTFAGVMDKLYGRLGPMVANEYQHLYGRKFSGVDNYYPMYAETAEWEKVSKDPFEVDEHVHDPDRITTVKDFLYERDAENVQLKLVSAFDVIANSILKETRFVAQERALYNAQTLMYDPDVKNNMMRLIGKDRYDNVLDGLKAAAGYQHEHGKVLDVPLMKLRNNFVKAAIGMNPFVAMKAGISWWYGMMYVDPKYMFKGALASVMDGDFRNGKAMMEMSPGFRERVLGGSHAETSDVLADKEVGRLIKSGGSLRPGMLGYEDALFAMIKFTDKSTVNAVMTAALLQVRDEIANGQFSERVKTALGVNDKMIATMDMKEKEATAIAYAEYVMDRTQPSFNPLNRNAFQRGSALERFFSIYGSFTTITHNMMMDAAYQYKHQGAKALPHISTFLGMWALTSVLNMGVNQARNYLGGKEPNPAWEWVLDSIFGNVFVVRDLNNAVKSKIKYGFIGNSSFIPIDELITGTADAAYLLISASPINGNAYDGEKMLKGIKKLTDTASKAAGLPMSVSHYPVGFYQSHMAGDEDWKDEWPEWMGGTK